MAIHSAKQLGLTKQALPHSIVEVVATLMRAGFEAYIVGGGVRDSLLGLAPKDFDAVTNARPQDIKAVFGGRCRIIGRRFQLAHVYSGREMIEVATFRAPPTDDSHTTEGGMITRDNVWGDINQDFARRDFSINALYYEPIRGEVHDFCGALDDIANKRLRLLGKASTRIEEDPVRLLRALRFKAKLGFEFNPQLARQFNKKNWQLLEQVSAHRLYDETQKMFSGGYLSALLPLLYAHGAMPSLMAHPTDTPSPLLSHIAANTDERVNHGRGANPAYFYAALLWENYLYNLSKFKKKGLPFYEAQNKAAQRTIERQRVHTAIPRFAEDFIVAIWLLQPRLTQPKPSEIEQLVRHPRFRAAYDFLVAREAADTHPLSEPTNAMGAWWTEYQLFDEDARAQMVDRLTAGNSRRRRSRSSAAELSQSAAELSQIHQLSLSKGEDTARAAPLFDTHHAKDGNAPNKKTKIKRTRPDSPMPVFAAVAYSEADFLRLLSEEPFMPSKRRHRSPSQALSVKERLLLDKTAQGDKNAPTAPKKSRRQKSTKDKTSAQTAATKAAANLDALSSDVYVAQTQADDQPKPKKKTRKKSNAKPRANHD